MVPDISLFLRTIDVPDTIAGYGPAIWANQS